MLKTTQKTIFFAAPLLALLALPANGKMADKTPPAYGDVVMTVHQHYSLTDVDQSGTISEGEYKAFSHNLKNQAADQASADFKAMDINGDGELDLPEFRGEMPSDFTV